MTALGASGSDLHGILGALSSMGSKPLTSRALFFTFCFFLSVISANLLFLKIFTCPPGCTKDRRNDCRYLELTESRVGHRFDSILTNSTKKARSTLFPPSLSPWFLMAQQSRVLQNNRGSMPFQMLYQFKRAMVCVWSYGERSDLGHGGQKPLWTMDRPFSKGQKSRILHIG